VRTREIDVVARRLGLTVNPGSRASADCQRLQWRLAGVEQAAAEPSFPFFIEWRSTTPHPGRTQVTHPAGAVHIAHLDLSGDANRLASWLGTHRLPITIRPGPPALTGIILTCPTGEITLDATLR
jgi:hypothetical protein